MNNTLSYKVGRTLRVEKLDDRRLLASDVCTVDVDDRTDDTAAEVASVLVADQREESSGIDLSDFEHSGPISVSDGVVTLGKQAQMRMLEEVDVRSDPVVLELTATPGHQKGPSHFYVHLRGEETGVLVNIDPSRDRLEMWDRKRPGGKTHWVPLKVVPKHTYDIRIEDTGSSVTVHVVDRDDDAVSGELHLETDWADPRYQPVLVNWGETGVERFSVDSGEEVVEEDENSSVSQSLNISTESTKDEVCASEEKVDIAISDIVGEIESNEVLEAEEVAIVEVQKREGIDLSDFEHSGAISVSDGVVTLGKQAQMRMLEEVDVRSDSVTLELTATPGHQKGLSHFYVHLRGEETGVLVNIDPSRDRLEMWDRKRPGGKTHWVPLKVVPEHTYDVRIEDTGTRVSVHVVDRDDNAVSGELHLETNWADPRYQPLLVNWGETRLGRFSVSDSEEAIEEDGNFSVSSSFAPPSVVTTMEGKSETTEDRQSLSISHLRSSSFGGQATAEDDGSIEQLAVESIPVAQNEVEVDVLMSAVEEGLGDWQSGQIDQWVEHEELVDLEEELQEVEENLAGWQSQVSLLSENFSYIAYRESELERKEDILAAAQAETDARFAVFDAKRNSGASQSEIAQTEHWYMEAWYRSTGIDRELEPIRAEVNRLRAERNGKQEEIDVLEEKIADGEALRERLLRDIAVQQGVYDDVSVAVDALWENVSEVVEELEDAGIEGGALEALEVMGAHLQVVGHVGDMVVLHVRNPGDRSVVRIDGRSPMPMGVLEHPGGTHGGTVTVLLDGKTSGSQTITLYGDEERSTVLDSVVWNGGVGEEDMWDVEEHVARYNAMVERLDPEEAAVLIEEMYREDDGLKSALLLLGIAEEGRVVSWNNHKHIETRVQEKSYKDSPFFIGEMQWEEMYREWQEETGRSDLDLNFAQVSYTGYVEDALLRAVSREAVRIISGEADWDTVRQEFISAYGTMYESVYTGGLDVSVPSPEKILRYGLEFVLKTPECLQEAYDEYDAAVERQNIKQNQRGPSDHEISQEALAGILRVVGIVHGENSEQYARAAMARPLTYLAMQEIDRVDGVNPRTQVASLFGNGVAEIAEGVRERELYADNEEGFVTDAEVGGLVIHPPEQLSEEGLAQLRETMRSTPLLSVVSASMSEDVLNEIIAQRQIWSSDVQVLEAVLERVDDSVVLQQTQQWYTGSSNGIFDNVRIDSYAGLLVRGLAQQYINVKDDPALLRVLLTVTEHATGISAEELLAVNPPTEDSAVRRFAELFAEKGYGSLYLNPPLTQAVTPQVLNATAYGLQNGYRVRFDTVHGGDAIHSVAVVKKGTNEVIVGQLGPALYLDVPAIDGEVEVLVRWNNGWEDRGEVEVVEEVGESMQTKEIVTNELLSVSNDAVENEILKRLRLPVDGNFGDWHNNIASSAHHGNMHYAVDFNIAGSADNTAEVKAAAKGKITAIDIVQGTVKIQHELPDGKTYETVYLHMDDILGYDYKGVRQLSKDLSVAGKSTEEIDAALEEHIKELEKLNQTVQKKWLNKEVDALFSLGSVGDEGFASDGDGGVKADSSGNYIWYSNGFHLHFEGRLDGTAINMYKWLGADHIDVASRRYVGSNQNKFLEWSDAFEELAIENDSIILDRSEDHANGKWYAIDRNNVRTEVYWDTVEHQWKNSETEEYWNIDERIFELANPIQQ